MMDIQTRWTIQKNPPRYPKDREEPWVIFETAAMQHHTPVIKRFASKAEAVAWAIENAAEDFEVILIKRVKRACSVCGHKL